MRLIITALLLSVSVFSQNYGLGAGTIIPKDKQMNPGYYIQADFIIKTDQKRDYLNNIILGAEHGGYMSNEKVISDEKSLEQIKTDCNCNTENINFAQKEYKQKELVRTVSLLFGAETFKNLYLITGVTSTKNTQKVNNEETSSYYTTHIDFGVKYYIKYRNSFIVPTIKFNPETFSFGVSYSR